MTKDGLKVTTRLNGDDYDISLNREDIVTDSCETTYLLEAKTLRILSYETTVLLLDGTSFQFQTKVTKNAEAPAALDELLNYEAGGSGEDETDEEPEYDSGEDSTDTPSSDSDQTKNPDSPDSSVSIQMQHEFYKNDGEMNILLVGNSYSYYWTSELWGLLDNAGYQNVTICNIYYSGCTFKQHWEWYLAKENNYSFFTVDDNGRKENKNVGMEFCMQQKNWDAISFQQSGGYMYDGGTKNGLTKFADSVNKYLPDLYQLFHSHFPKAKFYWIQHWVHEVGDADKGLKEKSTQETYANYYKTFAKEICPKYNFTNVPLGDAWQAVRHNSLFYQLDSNRVPLKTLHTRVISNEIKNNDLSHDGDVGGGQYLNAAVWFEIITKKSVVGNEFRPVYTHSQGIFRFTEEQIKLLQEAAHNAVLNCHGKNFYA